MPSAVYKGRLSQTVRSEWTRRYEAHPEGTHLFHLHQVGLRGAIDAWCEANFGPMRMDGTDRWHRIGGAWLIFDDADAVAFRLRWC